MTWVPAHSSGWFSRVVYLCRTIMGYDEFCMTDVLLLACGVVSEECSTYFSSNLGDLWHPVRSLGIRWRQQNQRCRHLGRQDHAVYIGCLCLSSVSKHQAGCCLICGMWWSGSECLLPARWLSERVPFPSSAQKFRKRNGCLCLPSMVLSYFDRSQSVLFRFLSGMCRRQWSLWGVFITVIHLFKTWDLAGVNKKMSLTLFYTA